MEPALDLRERGAPAGGAPQFSERRLFIQLQTFGGCRNPEGVRALLESRRVEGALYLDLHDPQGIGVLLLSEDPAWFVGEGRAIFNSRPLETLQRKPEHSLFGKTYAAGREADLEDWLLARPRRCVLKAEWPWAVWYPLRRTGEFALLSPDEQGAVLAEHAKVGISYGQGGYAADIRLVCYGLDVADNDFVIGLLGPNLHALSRLVQDMRQSQQTARFIQSLGPFFLGRVFWQSHGQ